MPYSVYIHTTPSHKVYIGITTRTINRRANSNGSGYMGCPSFYNAIQKHGWENIKHDILFTGLTKAEAEAKEIELIALHDSTNPLKGYNLDNGGQTVGTHSEATRAKMSEALKGKPIGRKANEETRRKLSQARSGNLNWNYGNALPDKQKQALSLAMQGRYEGAAHPRAKEIVCTTTGTIYGTIKDAAAAVGVARQSINKCCKGIRQHAGTLNGVKLQWQYKQERGTDHE